MEEKNIKVDLKFEGARLDYFLVQSFLEFSRAKIQKIIKEGNVLVNGKSEKSSYKVFLGDIIQIRSLNFEVAIKPQNIPLDIKFEDDNLIVLNKNKNMLTHPTINQRENTLVNALLFHCGDNLSDVDGDPLRRGIVHRLDKNTAGLMLVAKTNEAHLNLAKQIKEKTAIRKYRAVVYGEITEDEAIIDFSLKRSLKDTVKIIIADKNDKSAKSAITHFKVLERFEGATYVELELKTGRTHQIRAHMAALNHPLVGDSLYGAKGFKHKLLNKIKTNEQVLQSCYLKFAHPISGDIMEFKLPENEWDKDIIRILKILKENK